MSTSPVRRICFYAGPGSGKSTLAAKVFAELKARGHEVEFVGEWIKLWAILGVVPESYDQLYVLGNQLREEDARLRKVPVVITDSPVLMNTAYSEFYGFPHANLLVPIAQAFDRDFPALNFFIDRTVPYAQTGRYQDYGKAVEFDRFLLAFLSRHLRGSMIHVTVDQFDLILGLIEQNVLPLRFTPPPGGGAAQPAPPAPPPARPWWARVKDYLKVSR